MKHWIIADSGGTSTTWVWGSDQELGRMETGSLHPRNISIFSDEDQHKLYLLNQEFRFEVVDFYGAGMSSEAARKEIVELLSKLSFCLPEVKTDAVAAGIACCEFNHGYAAILGTGSILIEMDKGEMISRRGGLGPDKGDEGSAFYFGKLFLEEVKKGSFLQEVENQFGSVTEFLSQYSNCNPTYLAGLAKLTAHMDVIELHQKNIKEFITTHILVENMHPKEIGVIGSYGYHISSILKEELSKVDVLLNRVFATPLDRLVELKIKNVIG